MGRPRKEPAKKINKSLRHEIVGIFFISLAVLYIIFLITDAAGIVGAGMMRVMRFLVGDGRVLFPFIALIYGWQVFRSQKYSSVAVMSLSTLSFYLILVTFWHFWTVPAGTDMVLSGWEGVGGGVLGGAFSHILQSSVGRPGSYVIIVASTVISLVLMTNVSAVTAGKKTLAGLLISIKGLYRGLMAFLFTEVEEEETGKTEEIPVPVMDEEATASIFVDKPLLDFPPAVEKDEPEGEAAPEIYIYQGPKSRLEQPLPVTEIPVPGSSMPVESGTTLIESTQESPGIAGAEFKLPPLTLFGRNLRQKPAIKNKNINENIRQLEKTLASFGVMAKVTQVSVGPTITRYEIQPAPGVKVSRIVSLADDIALSLASGGVRIEAPIPGKPAVGIEVPNKEIATVHLRELLECMEFTRSRSRLSMILGKDVAGTPIVADLARMPHLLIAGATGSGKSVCMNNFISSILFKASPDEVKFLMIDPKKVELTTYNGIPHLLAPVVTDAKKAATALRWIVREMESRYELFAQNGAKDITRYNNSVRKGGLAPLPLVVVVIDELADLMMVAPADVEDAICRLAQMARAAGIHLLVATQRPSVDVITGLIKANIPSRISFAVSSQIDSRTILDMPGAEKLLGKGDMLFFPSGANKPVRVQGAYLTDKEVEDLVQYLQEQGEPRYAEISFPSESKSSAEQGEDDPLLPDAVRILIESGHASISLLQRRLRIGYTRAARLIDMMEEQGIVGRYEGSKPRAILMTMEQYRQKFGK